MKQRPIGVLIVAMMLMAAALLVACGTQQQQTSAQPTNTTASASEAPTEAAESTDPEAGEDHDEGEPVTEGDDHMDDGHMDTHSPEEHMAGSHGVPEEATEVENPIAASEDSITAGATLYAENCAVCHGETGEGDGPTAEGLEPPPADLHATHVQANTDGALFYIISHGRPDTAMPPWDNTLTEEERWHLVNYIRTFGSNDGAAADDADSGNDHADEGGDAEHSDEEQHTEGDSH